MRKYNDAGIIRLFQEKGINLFTLTDFAKLFEIANKQTLYKKIQRLEQKNYQQADKRQISFSFRKS